MVDIIRPKPSVRVTVRFYRKDQNVLAKWRTDRDWWTRKIEWRRSIKIDHLAVAIESSKIRDLTEEIKSRVREKHSTRTVDMIREVTFQVEVDR